MAKRLQLRGGTESEHDSFTGAEREITVDTTNNKLKLHDGVTVGGILVGGDLTPTPIITIADTDNENSTIAGSYTSVIGSEVTISAIKGVISAHDTSAKTFSYTAPDITDDADTTDTLTTYATRAGELKSKSGVYTLTIVYVPISEDDAISNANYQTNESYNDGFEY